MTAVLKGMMMMGRRIGAVHDVVLYDNGFLPAA
jgi:hypothetical protein